MNWWASQFENSLENKYDGKFENTAILVDFVGAKFSFFCKIIRNKKLNPIPELGFSTQKISNTCILYQQKEMQNFEKIEILRRNPWEK